MEEETYRVTGDTLLNTVKKIIAEGNARRIIIKNEEGESIVEFPLTVGAVGVLLAPMFAALGTIAALLTNCTIVVIRK